MSQAPLKDLSVEDARARMLAWVEPGPVETRPPALGGVLAEDVLAVRDQPPFDASAMDGWAIRRADARDAEARLAIVGESAAGHGFEGALQPGQSVRIFTGAPVPAGADMVVLQEEARRDGDHVVLGPAGEGKSNIRPGGGDFRAGEVLLAAGFRLDPWRIALASAAGRAVVAQRRAPSVAVLATGDEVVTPGGTPGPWQIFDSGSPALSALIERWGGRAERLRPTGDTEDAIAQAVAGCSAELIVTIGGASVGDHDLVKPALQRLGLQLAVLSIAVRPGKPTWFGRLADGRLVLGLPGNPASAFVCAELFLRPILAKRLGADPVLPMLRARLAAPAPAAGPREHWMRARLDVGADGVLQATPFPDQESSLVTVFAQADALVRRPAGSPAGAVGEIVEALRLERG